MQLVKPKTKHHPTLTSDKYVLKWPGTNSYANGSFITAASLISWVLKRSGTNFSVYGLRTTAFSHVPWVFRWSGTRLRVYGFLRTASMHMSSALRRSGTNSNEYGSIRTASSHISFVSRWFETFIMQRGTFANRDIFVNTLRPRQGSNFMDRKEWFKTPQPMFFMTYLSLIFVYNGCLAQQLKIIGEYIAKICCVKTMSIPHKKISGDISLIFFEWTLTYLKTPHYTTLKLFSIPIRK